MPQANIPLEEHDWQYKQILHLASGVNKALGIDSIEDSFLSDASNVRFEKLQVVSDNGYTTFQETVVGNIRRVYKFVKNNGLVEHLCITDSTFYKRIGTQWQYVSDGVSTTISANEAGGQTVISVTSTTGFSNGDRIGVTLNDGTQHKTTINGAPGGGTITIADALPSAANAGNAVVRAKVLAGNSTRQVDILTITSNDWVVFTNGIDIVQRYDGVTVENVPNLPSSGNTICRALGILANMLILFNTIEGGTYYPQRRRWCDVADPTNWTSGTAGFEDDLDNDQPYLAASRLGPYLIGYRSDSIFRIEYIGSDDVIFNPTMVYNGEGVRSTNGIASIEGPDGPMHVVLGNHSVYSYTGGFSIKSISDALGQDIFCESGGEIAQSKDHLSILMYLEKYNEVFVIYATTSATSYPNKIARVRMTDLAWSFRTFPIEICGFGSRITATTKAWQELSGAWSAQTWKWNDSSISSDATVPIICSGTQAYDYDYLNSTDNGTAISWQFDTKEFLDPGFDLRHDYLSFVARGSSVTVEYSKNSGASWNTLKTVALISLFARYRIEKQFVANSIMFRFKGTAPGFYMKWMGFKYIRESPQGLN